MLGVACGELGEWWAGLEHARRAAALLPTSAQLQYNLALTLLRLGEYREGFALMEARLDKPDWTGFATAPSRAAERRRILRKDEPVEGRRILVIVEQGLGDCIMFARYVPRLAERGAHVTVACSPPLRPVFERIGGVVELLSPPPDQPLAKINLTRAEFDAWVPLLSLPFLFAAELASVPAEIPDLTAAPPRVAAWRERFASAGGRGNLKIGLVFHANPASGSVLDRSIPIADLAPLFSLEGFDWVNLQGGAAGRRLMAEQPQAIDATKPDLPLDEFAAAVAATDLIVSVDTMAAHCAGALGHEAWLTIPFSPHWCWGIAGSARLGTRPHGSSGKALGTIGGGSSTARPGTSRSAEQSLLPEAADKAKFTAPLGLDNCRIVGSWRRLRRCVCVGASSPRFFSRS